MRPPPATAGSKAYEAAPGRRRTGLLSPRCASAPAPMCGECGVAFRGTRGIAGAWARRTRDARTDHAGGRLSYMPALDGLRALAVIAVLLYHGNVVVGARRLLRRRRVLRPQRLPDHEPAARRMAILAARRPAGVLDAARPPPPPGCGPRRRRGRGVRGHGGAGRSSCTSCAATRSRRSATSRTGTRSSPTSRTSSSTRRRRRCATSGRSRSKSSSTCSGRSSCSGCSAWAAAPAAPSPRRARVLATGSAVLMAVLYEPGTDPSRVYYGTDTRAQSLLIGALLATLLARRRGIASVARRRALHGGAIAAAIALAFIWSTTSEHAGWQYRGGFALAAVLVAVVITSVTEPNGNGPLGALLSIGALRSIGAISYGLYLWHWPIYVYLDEDRTQLDGAALLAFRLAVTLRDRHRVVLHRRAAAPARPAAAIGRGEWSHPSVPRPSRSRSWPRPPARCRRAFQEVSAAELAPPAAPGPVAAGVAVTAPAAPLRVMLVGDSVARSLGPGIGRAGATHGHRVLGRQRARLRARDGCRRALVRRVAGPRPTLRAGLARTLARAGRRSSAPMSSSRSSARRMRSIVASTGRNTRSTPRRGWRSPSATCKQP